MSAVSEAATGLLVVLNGFPAAGKYTILQHLRSTLPPERTRLLDNHLYIDPVTALHPNRGAEHHALRASIRAVLFQSVRSLVISGHIVLMTASLAAEDDFDMAILMEHVAIVRGTEIPMYWINAECSLEKLLERVGSGERVGGTKSKLTDAGVLGRLYKENTLIKPPADLEARVIFATIDTGADVDNSAQLLKTMITTLAGYNG
ncbi:hypothetical protein BJ742DRAFT_788464 [Cladochytrium replicatum]|nr:hypothetical protein BJ742DRAFT_788464 [Cladochytrium replicatum]